MNTTIGRVRFSDVTGQKLIAVSDVALDLSVGELLDGILPRMQLPSRDSSGRALEWSARLSRDGRHLNRSELAGDALRDDDEVQIAPNIDAG